MKPSACLVLAALSLSFKCAASSPNDVQVDTAIRTAWKTILDPGDLADTQLKLKSLQEELTGTFEALPKNSQGRLAPRVVQHMVSTYFTKEHGLHIEGFEHQVVQRAPAKALHELPILRQKAPGFAQVLAEAQLSERGLSLEEIVTVIIVLEQLLVMDNEGLLDISYRIWNLSAHDALNQTTMRSVLAYCALSLSKAHDDNTILDTVVSMNSASGQQNPQAKDVSDFVQEFVDKPAYFNRDHMNPFVPRRFNHEDAVGLLRQVSSSLGKWQDSACQSMKKVLMTWDPHVSGRVPLETIYSHQDTSTYFFLESKAFLEQTGALDKSQPGRPEVIITNYIQGPSNCVEPKFHYSICCLNECEPLMAQIESYIRAPIAEPEKLLGILRNLSSPSIDAPRRLPKRMVSKLWFIADSHGGGVPLHGRLFAQWMHYAFPWECPYPSVVADPKALKSRSWPGETSTVSVDEVQRYRKLAKLPGRSEVSSPAMIQWTDDEILLANEDEVVASTASEFFGWPDDLSKFWPFCRVVAQAAASLAMLLAGWRGLKQALQSSAEEENVLKPSRKQRRRIRGELGQQLKKRCGTSGHRETQQPVCEALPDESEDEASGDVRSGEDSNCTKISKPEEDDEEWRSVQNQNRNRRKRASGKRATAAQAKNQDEEILAQPAVQKSMKCEAELTVADNNADMYPESQPEVEASPIKSSMRHPELLPDLEPKITVPTPVGNSAHRVARKKSEDEPEIDQILYQAVNCDNSTNSEPELQPEVEPETEQCLKQAETSEHEECRLGFVPDSTLVLPESGHLQSLLLPHSLVKVAAEQQALPEITSCRPSEFKYVLPPAPDTLPPPPPPPGLVAPQRPPSPPPGLELMLIGPPPGLSPVLASAGLEFRPPPGLEDVDADAAGGSSAPPQSDLAAVQDAPVAPVKARNRWSRRNQHDEDQCMRNLTNLRSETTSITEENLPSLTTFQ